MTSWDGKKRGGRKAMWPHPEATEKQRGLVKPQERQQVGWQAWGIRGRPRGIWASLGQNEGF